MSTKYNGHKNYNHWNVSLWINNDEGLYCMVRDRLLFGRNRGYTRDQTAAAIKRELASNGITETPDGAPYSASAIRAAMVGM